MPDEPKIKPGPLSAHVASSLKRVRDEQHVTYTELVERLAQLGRPIPILGLRRIEKGERRVDIDELVALARALRVPAISLLFPLDADGRVVELLPGHFSDPNDAMLWFTGEGPMPSGLSSQEYDEKYGRGRRDPSTGLYEWYENPETGWEADAAPVLLRRQHQRQVADWYAAPQIARRLASDAASFDEMLFKLRAAAEDSLRTLRAEMRRHRLTLPDLPRELANLEGGTAGGARGGGSDQED